MLKKIVHSLILVVVLVIGYFAARESYDKTRPPPPEPTYQFLVLGDSYTRPDHVTLAQSWAQQVVNIFRDERLLVNDPDFVAKVGMQTERLGIEIEDPKYKGKYNLVLLQVGADDILAGIDEETYRIKFANLLVKAKALVEGDATRVLVLSIPDWTAIRSKEVANREQTRATIDRFNEINAEESSNATVRYIDITNLSRQAAYNLSFVSEDGTNPSDYMYEIWARKVYPVALTALGR
ncbi:MAG: SGNH/GDSL hydrolase family protein [Alphaproteobacteria bacterium]